MFSSKDFEKCWFLYQSEGLPYNLSIEEFCLKQGVPVNEFNKWYRDTHKRIHPIQVDGAPASEAKEDTAVISLLFVDAYSITYLGPIERKTSQGITEYGLQTLDYQAQYVADTFEYGVANYAYYIDNGLI